MILTNCAACAAPLPHKAKQCSRCKTRYCGPACQKQHWDAGGHDTLCKKIKKGGGAEQYHADKKYKEAVAVAAEKCADDTKGQTCFICTQALHWKTKEGLVRGCACRGTAGFAHVSCLAEQVKILMDEAEENNLDDKVQNARWKRWDTCSMCEQGYHGVVKCALGWAVWKTYVGRPETDQLRRCAMGLLGTGLSDAGHLADAVSVYEARLSLMRRLGAPAYEMLIVQTYLANALARVGRREQASNMLRDVYFGRLRLSSEEHKDTVIAANNYATSLRLLKRFEEAKSLFRNTIPVAQRFIGESDSVMLMIKMAYAETLYKDADATLDDLREAVTTLLEPERTARRVFGGSNPLTVDIEGSLRDARAALRARETPSSEADDLARLAARLGRLR